jgi:hypothetical protein
MPNPAVPRRKLVLSRETVRTLTEPEGVAPALVTTNPSDRFSCETRDC